MGRVENKVAIITGACGYLGSATAKLFAAEGARVLCVDIADDRVEALVADIEAAGGIASGLVADVTVEAQVVRMIDSAVATYGRLDILHNNATAPSGEGLDSDVVDTPDAEWDWALKINLYAAIWGCRHAIPKMLETGGGSIINMASMLHRLGSSDLIAIGVAKAAIVALGKYVATSHGRQGIRVNTIAPGFTMSPDRVARLPKQFSDIHSQHVLTPRLGIDMDQAYAALYLASDESAFMNGQLLEVDGGLGAHNPTSAQLAEAKVGANSYRKD